MPNCDRFVALERVWLVDILAVFQRLGKPAWDWGNIDPKQPELALLGLWQRSRNQTHELLLLRLTFFCRFFGVGNHKQVLDPIVNAAVFPPKQRTQAQLGWRTGGDVACQSIYQVQ